MRKRNLVSLILATFFIISSKSSVLGAESRYIEKKTLGGNSRYETAEMVSQYGFETSNNVILVNGDAIADALSATPFAKMKDAPILLTEKDNLNSVSKSEIKRLQASNVYIVGGKSVVSDNVVTQLRSIGCNVYRIYGKDRMETSLNVAKEIDKIEDVSEVAVVNGFTGIADALSVASPAAIRNMPIILSRADDLGSAEKWINSENISKNYIIGGDRVISTYLENNLRNTKRIYGQNRLETNAQVLEYFFNNSELYNIFLTKDGSINSKGLLDALVAAPVAAKQNSPIMLLGSSLNKWQEEYLKPRNTKKITQVGLGIDQSVANNVSKAIEFKNKNEAEVDYISYINCQQIEINFTSAIKESSVIYKGKLKPQVIDISVYEATENAGVNVLDEFNARLENGNKKLIITRDLESGKIFNGTYNIRVSNLVKTENNFSVEPFVQQLRIVDTVAPAVKKIEYDYVDGRLLINFTEPIKNFPEISINGRKVIQNDSVEFVATRDQIILNREKLNELETIGKTNQIIIFGGFDYRGLEMERYAESVRFTKPEVERKVEEVKIKNAKEFQIIFASPVDQSTIMESNGKLLKNNIRITSDGFTHGINDQILASDDLYGTLSPDRRTLTVKRQYNNDKNFDGNYHLVVTSSVKTTDGEDFAEYNEIVQLKDILEPEITSVKYDNMKGEIVILYSEPLKTKPDITISGGILPSGRVETFIKDTEIHLDDSTRSRVTVSYDAIKKHKLIDVDEPDGATFKINITNANDFVDRTQVEYKNKDIHIKPIYEGFKVDKVVPASENPKPGENEYIVYFNEKILKPTGEHFLIEGIEKCATNVEFIVNPETHVADSKVIKVTFGEGTINVGDTNVGEERILSIKDIKSQAGSVMRSSEAKVMVRDNTAPTIVKREFKASTRELTIEFSEPMNFESIPDNTSKFTAQYEVTSKIGSESYNNNQLSSISNVKKVGDRTLVYTFNGTENFDKMMTGQSLILKHSGGQNDLNGVTSKTDKGEEIYRTELAIGYIKSLCDSSKHENKFEVWFSETPKFTKHNINIYLQKEKVDVDSDFIETSVKNNIVTITMDRSTVKDDTDVILTIKDVISAGGNKPLVNPYEIADIKVFENMESILKNASYDYATRSMTLDFDRAIKTSTLINLFNSIEFTSDNLGTLKYYPKIEIENSTLNRPSIKLKFVIEGNKNSKEFLDYMLNAGTIYLQTGSFGDKNSSKVLDIRGWELKQREAKKITLLESGKPIVNNGDKGTTRLNKAQYFSGDQVLRLTFSDRMNTQSIKDNLFNSINVMYKDIDMMSYGAYPTVGNITEVIDNAAGQYTYDVQLSNQDKFESYINKGSNVFIVTDSVYFEHKTTYNFITDQGGKRLYDSSITLEKLASSSK